MAENETHPQVYPWARVRCHLGFLLGYSDFPGALGRGSTLAHGFFLYVFPG